MNNSFTLWLPGIVRAPSQIKDEDEIYSIKSRFGYEQDFWDDGYGPLWIHRCSMGCMSFVRALRFEQAYECYTDELAPDGDENIPLDENSHEFRYWEEANTWRGNSVPSNHKLKSHIAAIDVNGELLEKLSDEIASELGITIMVLNVYPNEYQAPLSKWDSYKIERWNAGDVGHYGEEPGRRD